MRRCRADTMRVVLTMICRVVIAAPKRVLLVVMGLTVVAAVFGANVAEHLGAGGFQDPSSQSARGVKVLTEKFGLGNMDLTLVVRSPSDVLEPAAAEAGRRLVDEVRNAPFISGVVSPWDDESARREGLISEDGKTALVIARVSGGENNAPKYAKDVADRVVGVGTEQHALPPGHADRRWGHRVDLLEERQLPGGREVTNHGYPLADVRGDVAAVGILHPVVLHELYLVVRAA
jgi:uncharacterized membrane protein YdfJ with MMPL/SSD domain